MNGEVRLQNFTSWVRENLGALRAEPAEVVADRFGDAVLAVDAGLGVEVSREQDVPAREAIITAFSNPSLFSLVRRMTDSLFDIPGWRFVALKPPRGFEFTITLGRRKLEAKNLEFVEMADVIGGISLVTDQRTFDSLPEGQQREELAWLIVETGVGEELAVLLAEIGFSDDSVVGRRHRITDLASYLAERKHSGEHPPSS